MNDFAPSPLLEDEVCAAIAAPHPEPAFVNSLRTRLVLEADKKVQARPRPQVRLAWAISLVVAAMLLIAVLVIGPGRVLAAVRSALGYLPGLGLVQNDGSLRVLAEPVQVVRDGVTLTVEQGAADARRTVIVYSVEGLSAGAAGAQGEGAPAGLLLPNGTSLRLLMRESYGRDTGYRARLVFPAVPPGARDLVLVISRLDGVRPGAAPEDWRIPLRLEPAPPGTQMLPVQGLEPPLPGAGLPAAGATSPRAPAAVAGSAPDTSGPGLTNAGERDGIRFELLEAVELSDDCLLQGRLAWQGDGEATATLSDAWPALHDANGRAIPASPVTPDVPASPAGAPAGHWALRTEGKSYPGPWTLTLAAARLEVAADARFEVDLGPNPGPGQAWQLDRELSVAGRRLEIRTARLSAGDDGRDWLEFDFASGSGLAAIGVWDLDQASGVKARSSGTQGGQVTAGIGYQQAPTGLRRLAIRSATYAVEGPWEVTWMPEWAQ